MTRHRHGEEEWEQLRLTISDLSTEENKTSQQIVEILEKDHGFKTGIRKLKEKMMDWGLTKYIKKADMKILISKKEQRQSLGKETIFFHHGEQLSDKRLITFSKRSSTKDSPVPPHDAPTPPEVTYHTPAAADVAISHNCHNDTATLSPERTPVSRALQKRTLNELPDSSLTSNGQISKRRKHNNCVTRISISQRIDRLCGLSAWNNLQLRGDDDTQHAMNRIISDLQGVLNVALQHMHVTRQYDPNNSSLQFMNPGASCERLRQFALIFGRSNLAVNKTSAFDGRMLGRTIRHKHLYDEIQCNAGRISLLSKESLLSFASTDQMTEQTDDHRGHVMTVCFRPTGRQRSRLIVASVFQEILNGTALTVSHLVVNNVIASDSCVFNLVREGDVLGLRRLFQDGGASPRDHDEYGASLLFYCASQPKMFKYLISCGLDVNHVAPDIDILSRGTYLITPLSMMSLDSDLEFQQIKIINECRTALLEAGADPTISADENVGNFQSRALFSSMETIQMTWNPNLTGHFTSLTDFVFGPGYNALNYLCMNAENGTQPDVVAYLLSQGVDINSRNHGGDTCLHTFVKNLRCYIQRESDVLHLLVRNGAEIHALNSYGCSVSFCAYYKEFACFEGLGSYRGDLWDAVIQKYGCNLVKHRAHQPRRAIYTEKYTRSHFEALWKGAEHLCPYWDDKPWPLHVCVACGLEEDSSDGESYVRAGKVHGKSRAKDEHFTDEGSYADDEQSSIDDGESFTNDSRTDGDEI